MQRATRLTNGAGAEHAVAIPCGAFSASRFVMLALLLGSRVPRGTSGSSQSEPVFSCVCPAVGLLEIGLIVSWFLTLGQHLH